MRNPVNREQLLNLLNEVVNDPDRLWEKLGDERVNFNEIPFKYGVLKKSLELLINRLQEG